MSYITCTEYRLFIDESFKAGKHRQPDHWPTRTFPTGDAQKPIAGVRGSDAEEFCEWLNKKYSSPGFRYRLPTSLEVEQNPATEKQLGCWCKDGESLVIAGIEPSQWQDWQTNLADVLDRVLALDNDLILARDLPCDCALLALALDDPHNLVLDLTHASIYTDELALAHNRDPDLVKALDDAYQLVMDRSVVLNDIFTISVTISCVSDHALYLDRTQAQVRAYARALAHNFAIAQTINRSQAQALIYQFDQAYNRARSLVSQRDKLIKRARALAQAIDRTRNHARALAQAIDPTQARDFAIAQAIDRTRNHALEIVRNSSFIQACDLPRNLAYGPIRSYLLLIAVLWHSLSNAFERTSINKNLLQSSRLTPQAVNKLKQEYATRRDEIFKIYAFFVLLDERRERRIPAWEGIRLVRERLQE